MRKGLFPLSVLAAVGALWIAVAALKWELVEVLTVFLMPFLEMFVFALVAVTVVACLVLTVAQCIRRGLSSRISLRIAAMVVLAALPFVRWDNLYEAARFRVLAGDFDRAAAAMLTSDAQESMVPLPDSDKWLSRGGGEVTLLGDGDGRCALFYSFRGILDNFSVYAYAPSGAAYASLMGYSDWVEVIPLREHWYFCAST